MPFEYITEVSNFLLILQNIIFRLFGLLKIIRVSRLSSLINKSAMDEETKSLFRTVILIFYLTMILHVLAGIWNVIIEIE